MAQIAEVRTVSPSREGLPHRVRLIFWATIVVTLAGVVLLSAWLVYQNRRDVEAWWYLQRLDQCTTWEQAEPWQKRLWKEPGRQTRYSAAMRQFMDGYSSMADFWLINGSSGGFTDDPAVFSGVFLTEAHERPSICRAMIHNKRWVAGREGRNEDEMQVHMAEAFQRAIEEPWRTNPDGTQEFRSALENTKLTRVLCWLTAQDEMCHDLAQETWEKVYARWQSWYKENGQFLVFDSEQDRYLVDSLAKASGEPVARERQLAPPAETPLPNWRGPVP